MADGRAVRAAWRPLRAAAIAVAALTLVACDSVEERVEEHHASAVELVEAGEDVRAALEFRNALQLESGHAPSRRGLAGVLEREGDLRGAISQYRAAADLDPEDLGSRVKLARLLTVGGALDEALDYADQALALAPDDVEALATKASVALALGDAEEALSIAGRALEIAPDDVDANVVLIGERIRAGDLEAALARVDRLLETAPRDHRLNVLKLRILNAMDDPVALGRELERIVELFPEDLNFRRALAQWRLRQDDVAGAEAQLRKIAEISGEADAALDVVRLIVQRRGLDAARAELDALIAGAEDADAAFPFRLALASLEWGADRPDEAKAILRAAAESDVAADLRRRAQTTLAAYLVEEGEATAARELIEAVLSADETNVDALALRANLAIEDYRPRDAIRDLRAALDVDPQNARLMMLEARAHERNGSLDLAGERLAAAARASNYQPDIAGAYVRFLRGRNQLSAAEAVMSEIVRRHPSNRQALAELAGLRIALQDWAGADRVAAQLRALDEGAPVADRISAAALAGQGRLGESTGLLERLAADPSTENAALAALVSNYVRAGDTAQAVDFLERVLAEDPQNVRALILRAELHLLAGETDQAEARLREAVDAAPDLEGPRLILTRFQIQQGRVDEAERLIREGLERGESEQLRLLLAQLLEQRGAFDEAIEVYTTLYEMNPESIVYSNNLASLLAEYRSDDPESLRFASRVAQRLRGYDAPELQDTYGWVTFLNGDPDAALRALAPAAEALPGNALVQYHAGRVYAAVEEFDRARAHLEAALAADADFSKADSARETLATLPPAAPGE